ncbi:MAG: hypothetical protein KBD78_06240 [Oligoflexales bacterium]|nr:hypothetical protein [Oligoflexales bacterium]
MATNLKTNLLSFRSKFTFVALFVLLSISCAQDDDAANDIRLEQLNESNFRIDADERLFFKQGLAKQYSISYKVPDGYTAKLSVSKLPPGASFSDGVLTWLPPCSWHYKDGKFFMGKEVLVVTFKLTVEEDKLSSVTKHVVLEASQSLSPGDVCSPKSTETEKNSES